MTKKYKNKKLGKKLMKIKDKITQGYQQANDGHGFFSQQDIANVNNYSGKPGKNGSRNRMFGIIANTDLKYKGRSDILANHFDKATAEAMIGLVIYNICNGSSNTPISIEV